MTTIFQYLLILLIITHSTLAAKKKKLLSILTMNEAVELAYAHKPDLLAFKHFIQANKMDEKLAWSGYYPLVTLASSIESRSPIKNPHSAVGLHVDQLIFNFAGPQELARRAVKATTALRFREETKKNDLRLAVEAAFLEGWRQQQQRQAQETLYHSSKEILDKASHSNRLDLLDKNDWLKAVESHSADLSSVFVYQDELLIAQKTLEFFTGYACKLDFRSISKKNTQPITRLEWHDMQEVTDLEPLESYQKLALTHRPEIQERQKLIEIEEVNMVIERNSRLPIFSLFADVDYDDARFRRTSNAIGIAMTFPIFDQLKSDYGYEKFHALKMAAMLAKQEIIQEIRLSVDSAYHQLSQEFTKFKAEKFRYIRAENEYQLGKLQYENGIIGRVDFESVKINWQNERFVWINQRVNLELKRRQLMHDCGYPITLDFS